MRNITLSITALALLGSLSVNANAAQCESNFSSSGNFITGTTYKTFAELPSLSLANAYEGALADITKEPSWKVLAQDKSKGMIQAVQAEQYDKGKVIPLNINIIPSGGGVKISMDYVTPTGSLSPESAVKSQFCQTILAAENGSSSQEKTQSVSRVKSEDSIGVDPIRPLNGLRFNSDQKKRMVKQLTIKDNGGQLKTMISEARPTIEQVLEMQACFYPTGSYGLYLTEGGNYHTLYDNIFNHHDKSQCVNVQRIKDWKIKAKNAFGFRVLYVSEQSGQNQEFYYSMEKQLDGTWLFDR
jgi:hypothetical protein